MKSFHYKYIRKAGKTMDIIQTDDIAKLLKVNKRTVQNQAKEGIFPPNVCRKCGRKYYFNKDAFIEWFFSGQAQIIGVNA